MIDDDETGTPLNNLLRLTHLDRIVESRKDHADNPAALAALDAIEKLLDKEHLIPADCSECEEWDGRTRRCCCGNRRMYWQWDASSETFQPTAY